MSHQDRPLSRSGTFVVGALAAAVGLFMVLAAIGVIPFKPGPQDGPLWILACAGLAFMLGGGSILLHAAAGGVSGEDLPQSAPRWIPIAQYLMGLTVVGALALIGTWVAFGGGPRSFDISAPFFASKGGGEAIGRTVFGIGAVLTWLCLIALAVGGARKLFKREKA